MDLENIILSEVSQAEKGKHCVISLVWGILRTQQAGDYNTKEADSDTENKLMARSGETKEEGT